MDIKQNRETLLLHWAYRIVKIYITERVYGPQIRIWTPALVPAVVPSRDLEKKIVQTF